MAVSFSITVPQDQIDKLEAAIGKESTRNAIYQAVYRTTRAGVAIFREQIRARYMLDAKYANRAVTTRISSSYSDKADAVGHIIVSPKIIPLIAYGDIKADKKHSEMVIIVNKGRAPIFLRHAFYAKVGTGAHKGIFLRARGRDKSGGKVMKSTFRSLKVGRYEGGKLTAGGFARRFPIEEQFGPSVVDAFGESTLTDMGQAIIKTLSETMVKNLQSQMNRFGASADVGVA